VAAGNRKGPVLASQIFGAGNLDQLLKTQSESVLTDFIAERVRGDFAFFMTWDGHMGLESKLAQEGETVSVLFGTQLPFLLRQMGEHYRFLGECYVYGIMKEEAMEELKAGRFTEERFPLR